MNLLPQTSQPGGASSDFWSKKNSIPAYIILGAIGVAIFMFWGAIVPFVLTVLQDTVEAAILGGVLFIFLMMAMNPRIRATVAFLFQHFCTWLCSFAIDVYPLDIIRANIAKMRKSCDEIRVAMTKLQGAMQALKKTVDDNNTIIQQELGLANEAKRQGKLDQAGLHANQAQRKIESNKTYEPIYNNQNTLYQTLGKVYHAADLKVKDKTDEVDELEIRWKTSQASSNAVSAAKKIFNGTIESDMAAEAAKKMETDISNETGAFIDFMDNIHDTLDTIDLNNGMMTTKGLELLEKANTTDFTTFLNNDKRPGSPELIMVPKGGSVIQPLGAYVPEDNGFKGLI